MPCFYPPCYTSRAGPNDESLYVLVLDVKTSCGFSATASALSIFRRTQVCVSQLRLWSVRAPVCYSDTCSPSLLSLSPPPYFSSLQKWQRAARGIQMHPSSSISSSSPWTHARTYTQSAPTSSAVAVSPASPGVKGLLPSTYLTLRSC